MATCAGAKEGAWASFLISLKTMNLSKRRWSLRATPPTGIRHDPGSPGTWLLWKILEPHPFPLVRTECFSRNRRDKFIWSDSTCCKFLTHQTCDTCVYTHTEWRHSISRDVSCPGTLCISSPRPSFLFWKHQGCSCHEKQCVLSQFPALSVTRQDASFDNCCISCFWS